MMELPTPPVVPRVTVGPPIGRSGAGTQIDGQERRMLEDRRDRIRDRISARKIALARLWRQAVSRVRIAYPDPRVDVELNVATSPTHEGVTVNMYMWGLRDTKNPDSLLSCPSEWEASGWFNYSRARRAQYASFKMFAHFTDWPGEEVARVCLLGVWLTYVQHEAAESVTWNWFNPAHSRVTYPDLCWEILVNPHHKGHLLDMMERTLGNHAGSSMLDIAALAVGEDKARSMMAAAAERARRELHVETDLIEQGGEWQ